MYNDHKPLQKFLNGKNANNKVTHWLLKLATYNMTFKWIFVAHNKAVDCLSRLVEVTENSAAAASILINAVTASPAVWPATQTQSKTTASVEAQPSDTTKINAPPPLTGDHKDTFLQMQWTDPLCKCISKQLINEKAPYHESDMFTQIDGLLNKHAMDAPQKILALVIPKAWHFTVLVKVHNKLGHQGVNRT